MACKNKLSEMVATDDDIADAGDVVPIGDGFDGGHPSDRQLDDYSNGRLEDKELREVDDHVAACSTCCERLLALPVEDHFLDKLRTAEASARVFPNGRRIADYRLVRVIGQGGMGIVYEAMQVSLCRRVALKVLHTSNVHDAESLRRFRREARAAANLHHTNIVPIFEIGETEDCQYFAMQLIQGRSLAQVYDELRDTPQAAADISDADLDHELHARSIAQMGAQVAGAIAHAHARGVVHRDIKPSNLLLDDTGVVWVADFGLAKMDDDELTQSGQLLGTLRYLSPERFRGVADERCDIYALGASLYELLVRQRLFEASDRVELMQAILQHEPPAPCHLDPNLPRDLETIVLKAIAKDPAKRYQTAAEMADDLLRFCDQEEISARRLRLSERLLHSFQANTLIHVLVAALVLGLLLSLGLLIQRADQTNHPNRSLDAATRTAPGRDLIDPEFSSIRSKLIATQQLLISGQRKEVDELMQSGRALASLQQLSAMLDTAGSVEAENNTRLRIASILSQSPRPLTSWQQIGPIRQLRFETESSRLLFENGEGVIRSRSLLDPNALTASVTDVAMLDRPNRKANDTTSKLLAWNRTRPHVSMVSHDGSQVAFASSNSAGSSGDSVWLMPIGVAEDRSFPLPRKEIPATGLVTALAFSEDDRYLAIGNLRGLIRVWDLAVGEANAPLLSIDALIELLKLTEDAADQVDPINDVQRTSADTLSETSPQSPSARETARAVCAEAGCVAVAILDQRFNRSLGADGRPNQQKFSMLQLSFHSKTPLLERSLTDSQPSISQPTVLHYNQPIGWLRWDARAAVLIVSGVEGQFDLIQLQPEVRVTTSFVAGFQVTCADLDLTTGRIAIGGVDDRGFGAVQLWDSRSSLALTPIGRSAAAITGIEFVAGATAAVCRNRDSTSWMFAVSELNESVEEIQAEVQWILGYRVGPDGSPIVLEAERWDSLRQRGQSNSAGLANRVSIGSDSQRVQNWYLQRIDEALGQQQYAIARARIEQLPSSLRQSSRVKLIEGLVAMREGQLDLAADTLRGVVAASDWIDLSENSLNTLMRWLVAVESKQRQRNLSEN